MADIREAQGICTHHNGQAAARQSAGGIELMIARARFMATQPGFVSINLHRSKDGGHLVNYIKWTKP